MAGGGREGEAERGAPQPSLPRAEASGSQRVQRGLIPGRQQDGSLTKHKWVSVSGQRWQSIKVPKGRALSGDTGHGPMQLATSQSPATGSGGWWGS